MSYILEALKKAQAERQIGSTPTIHAPTLAAASPGQGARSKRIPVIVAMVLMGTAIAGLAAMLVRQQSGASKPPAAPVVEAPAVAASPPPAAVQPPSAAPVAAQPAAVTQTALAQPRVAAPASAVAQAPAFQPVPQAAMQQTAQPQPVPHAPQASAPAPAPAATPQAPAAAPVEEPVQALRELPEPIQRAIPQITLGGYMYSKNPADRLLLIDKVLRREGEEVAPGLVLEKLQPKQAIFGFRGYRYRVAL